MKRFLTLLVAIVMLSCVSLLAACSEGDDAQKLLDRNGGFIVEYTCDVVNVGTIADAMKAALVADKYSLVIISTATSNHGVGKIIAKAPKTNDARYKNHTWVAVLDGVAGTFGITRGGIDAISASVNS